MANRLWTWEQAITKSGLEPTTRLILFTLATFMNKHGKSCYPSIPTIADASGLGERTVSKHIKIANEKGWLVLSTRKENGQKWEHNFYEASWPNQGGAPYAGVQESAKGGAPDADNQSNNSPISRYPIPQGWMPKQSIIDDAIEVGFTEDEIYGEIEGFIDYWTGESRTRKGKKSERGWHQAFRNRINSLEKQWGVRYRKPKEAKSGRRNTIQNSITQNAERRRGSWAEIIVESKS